MTEQDESTIEEINAATLGERLELLEKLFQMGVGEDREGYFIKDGLVLGCAFRTLQRMIHNDGKV